MIKRLPGRPDIPAMVSIPITVRAYAEAGEKGPRHEPRTSRKSPEPSDWELIFDTETTTGAAKAIRFGTYQLRKGGALCEAGLFYSTDTLTGAEQKTLRR